MRFFGNGTARRRLVQTSLLGLALALVGTGLTAGGGLGVVAKADANVDQALFGLINSDRAGQGLAALTWNQDLHNIAETAPARVCASDGGRAEDMIERNYFAHQIQGCGDLVFAVETAYGISFTANGTGENIGATWGFDGSSGANAAAYTNAQMMAEGPPPAGQANHYSIIMGAATDVGVGSWYTSGCWDGQCGGSWVFVEDFANHPSAATISTGPALVPPPSQVAASSNAPNSAVVNWTAPAGSISNYLVTTYDSNHQVVGSPATVAGPETVTGLSNGTTYYFTVAAEAGGTSSVAVASNPVTPLATPPVPSVQSIAPNSGPIAGGQTVRVTGSGFAAGMTVTVGGVGVSPLDISPTGFSFVAPAGSSGGASVVVTTTGGISSGGGVATYSYIGLASYFPLTPFRILDTRAGSCTQCGSGALRPGEKRTVQISGVSGLPSGVDRVPSNATAVVLNVTSVGGSKSSLLTVYPTGSSLPTASNLNFPAGQTIANLVTAELGQISPSDSNREVNIYNAAGTVNVVADVEGYFAPQSGSNPAGEFHTISPLRVCDTRAGQSSNGCNQGRSRDNQLGNGQAMLVKVTGVPSGVSGTPPSIPGDGTAAAGVLNLTAIAGSTPTFLSVYPPDLSGSCASRPNSSNINVGVGVAEANRVMVPLGPAISGGLNNSVCVFNAAGRINFTLDASGWFGAASAPTGAQFQAIAPTRICDTRAGNITPCSGSQLAGSRALVVAVDGVNGIPGGGGPVAIIANLTAIAGSCGTYLNVYPADLGSKPNASDLNVVPGAVLPNLVVVGLSSGAPSGSLKLFNAAGNINAVIDVEGWFQ